MCVNEVKQNEVNANIERKVNELSENEKKEQHDCDWNDDFSRYAKGRIVKARSTFSNLTIIISTCSSTIDNNILKVS